MVPPLCAVATELQANTSIPAMWNPDTPDLPKVAYMELRPSRSELNWLSFFLFSAEGSPDRRWLLDPKGMVAG